MKLLVFVFICLLIFSALFFSSFQNQWSLYSEIQKDLERCRTIKQRSFWFFYYVKPEDQSFGLDGLEVTLSTFNRSLRYSTIEFDPREMSGYLERYLENQGWNTSIATSSYRPWLLVETDEGNFTPVEAKTLEIIYDDNEFYDDYFDYDHLFKNIYSANDFAPDNFNWWVSYGLYTDPEWIEYYTP